MQGRYWVPVLFTGILIIALGFKALVKQLGDHRPVVAAAAGVASVVLFCSLYAFAHSVESWKRRGPLHDRSVARALLKPDLTWDVTRVAAGWRKAGLEAKRRARDSREKHVVIRGPIGFFGEAAGSEVTIVDPVGLADPLLARLPLRNPKSWRPGHLLRPIPRGYLHARQTGSLDRMEPSLAEYYRHLRLVVEGPLFSWERLTTIVGFHVGRYDHLLEGWKPQAGRR